MDLPSEAPDTRAPVPKERQRLDVTRAELVAAAVVAGGALGALGAWLTPNDDSGYAAIAVSDSGEQFGASFRQSAGDAMRTALAQCEQEAQGCRVATVIDSGCADVAAGPTDIPTIVGRGKTPLDSALAVMQIQETELAQGKRVPPLTGSFPTAACAENPDK